MEDMNIMKRGKTKLAKKERVGIRHARLGTLNQAVP